MRLVALWNNMVNKCCIVGCCCNCDGKITVPTFDKVCLIEKFSNQALLHLLYVSTSSRRSFKVKRIRLINSFKTCAKCLYK